VKTLTLIGERQETEEVGGGPRGRRRRVQYKNAPSGS
jgi:hypothetical protein